jgi:hypothetical protein
MLTSNMQQNKPKKRADKSNPKHSWQTGAYSRKLQLNILLPHQFLMLCRLWETTPETIITDFLDNLAHASWKREGRDAAKQKLVEYILFSGYGKQHYTEENLLQMFKELDAIGLLFPTTADDKTVDAYVAFREAFHEHWFRQWYYKTTRKPLNENP